MASSQIVAILFHVAPSRMLLQLQCPQRNAIKTTIVVSVWHDNNSPESKRDQEEGGELDSHEEASPEEIKSREVVLGYRERELELFCFSCFHTAERSYGHCLCGFVLHSSWNSSCVVLWSLRNAGRTLNILLFWRQSTAALVFSIGACFKVSLFCPPFPLVPIPNCPSRLRGRYATKINQS